MTRQELLQGSWGEFDSIDLERSGSMTKQRSKRLSSTVDSLVYHYLVWVASMTDFTAHKASSAAARAVYEVLSKKGIKKEQK